jgi:hypothetical protein
MVEPSERQGNALDLIRDSGLPNIRIHKNKDRLGVLTNPWAGMNMAFDDGAEFAFVTEEDVIVSDDILEYVSWGREYFRDSETCMGLCANIKFPDPANPAQVFYAGFDPLGWGTWEGKWERYLKHSWDHDYSSGDPGGWDHNINHRILPKRNMNFAFPSVSRTDHVGKHEGVHMISEWFEASQAPTFQHHIDKQNFYFAQEYLPRPLDSV